MLFSSLWVLLVLGCSSKVSSADLSPLLKVAADGTLLKVLMDSKDPRVSSNCRTALGQLRKDISADAKWAREMVDATAKIPSGVLEGSITYLGSFDQCLRIVSPSSQSPNEAFVGQYCPVTLQPALTNDSDRVLILINFRWDLCVPSSCSPQDLTFALSSVSESYAVTATVQACEIQMPTKLDVGQIVSVVILSILAVLLISGTCTEAFSQIRRELNSQGESNTIPGSESKWRTFLVSFSVYSNALRLLDTSSGGNLDALNGLRVLSTFWIIVGHSYYYIDWALVGNSKQAVDVRFNFFFQPIMNFSVTVDTFFFMSGLLVVYSNLRKLAKSPHISWFQFYFHRYWRLTPPVALLIVFLLVWPLLGSGPYWSSATVQAQYCKTNWWANLLYINNFYQLDKPCLEHCWYLATDMQFYILSPLIFYPMWRWPKLGLAVNGAFLVTSVVTPAVLGVTYKLLPTSLPFAEGMRLFEQFKLAYVTPYCRMGPYCVGMALGYFLVHKRTLPLSPIRQLVMWCLSLTLISSVMYGVYSWNAGQEHSPGLNAFYLSTHRTCWALGIAWIVYACLHGHAGILNRILSWKGFVPLSRLTFVAYLIHVFVLRSFSGLLGDRLVFSHFVWIVIIMGVISTSFCLAFVTSLCAEMPFQRLERLIWPPHKTSLSILSPRKTEESSQSCKESAGHVNSAFQDIK